VTDYRGVGWNDPKILSRLGQKEIWGVVRPPETRQPDRGERKESAVKEGGNRKCGSKDTREAMTNSPSATRRSLKIVHVTICALRPRRDKKAFIIQKRKKGYYSTRQAQTSDLEQGCEEGPEGTFPPYSRKDPNPKSLPLLGGN